MLKPELDAGRSLDEVQRIPNAQLSPSIESLVAAHNCHLRQMPRFLESFV